MFSILVLIAFWFLAINSLISFDAFVWGSISTVGISGGYYFVVDQYVRWKLRRSKVAPAVILEMKT